MLDVCLANNGYPRLTNSYLYRYAAKYLWGSTLIYPSSSDYLDLISRPESSASVQHLGLDPQSGIRNPKSGILDRGCRILTPRSPVPWSRFQQPGSWNPGSRSLDLRSWIQDLGSRSTQDRRSTPLIPGLEIQPNHQDRIVYLGQLSKSISVSAAPARTSTLYHIRIRTLNIRRMFSE